MLWRIPTYHGDISLEATSPKTCKVLVHEATPEEKRALEVLTAHAVKKKWIPLGTTFGMNTLVTAPVADVASILAKALKPGKKLVHAVKFSNGKIEEVTASTFKVASPGTSSPAPTPTSSVDSPVVSAAAPVAATTVAKPVLGCPPPDFPPARLRAWHLLTTFLNDEQMADLERFNRFITVGGTTGHRYMITSRTARDELKTYKRSLFDLDENRPFCVHDYDIPPEEEMHALNLLVQMPGYEHYLRHLETA